MRIIDLRSDTLTLPTPVMRRAMAEAEVGDDVYAEDPTINRLEAMAAERMGKDAALFVTSGTQANLIAIMGQARHGQEIIVGDETHIFWYEVGGPSALAGVVMRTLPNDANGRMDLDQIASAIRDENIHYPETALVCLENTHNRCGGAALTEAYTNDVCALAHRRGLKVHMDGARIFNAAVALRIPAAKLVENADSVFFALSKGLSAPVGSLLCGSREFVARGRKLRKMLGGGMRQAGILAAAGIVALETMVDRLAEDHANAQRLAGALAGVPYIEMLIPDIPTNILVFELREGLNKDKFLAELARRGVKVGPFGGSRFRAVTSRMVSTADIDEAAGIMESVCRKLAGK